MSHASRNGGLLALAGLLSVVALAGLRWLSDSLGDFPPVFTALARLTLYTQTIALVLVSLVWGAIHTRPSVARLVASLFYQAAIVLIAWFSLTVESLDEVLIVVVLSAGALPGGLLAALPLRAHLVLRRYYLQSAESDVPEGRHPLRRQFLFLLGTYLTLTVVTAGGWFVLTIQMMEQATGVGMVAMMVALAPFCAELPVILALGWARIVLGVGPATTRKIVGWSLAVGVTLLATGLFANPVWIGWKSGKLEDSQSMMFLLSLPIVFAAAHATLFVGLLLIRRTGVRCARPELISRSG